MFVGVFKVDVGRNKAALHHQYGVNHLACARHPALVPCHSFGRTNPGHVLAKQSVERDGLEHVALQRRCGVRINVIDVGRREVGIVQRACHGRNRPFVAGLRYAAAVARKAISHHFAQDCGTPRHGMVVLFEHQCSRTTARYQSVAVAVEGSRGTLRVVHALRKGAKGIECGHRVEVNLLCAAAKHRVLQPLFNHHVAQSDSVTATGACRTDGEVDAAQVENGA